MNYPIEIDRLASTLEHKASMAEIRADSRMDRLQHEFSMLNMKVVFSLIMFFEFQIIVILWVLGMKR
jgi:hypothetical protein